MTIVFASMVIGGLIGIPYFWFADNGDSIGQRMIIVACAFGNVVFGIVFIFKVHKSHIVLCEDSIEDVGLVSRRQLQRADILGKMLIHTGCPTIVLYPRSKAQKVLMIGIMFAVDVPFERWMASVPDITVPDL